MLACPPMLVRHASDAVWRAFLRLHPNWLAPAPAVVLLACGGAAGYGRAKPATPPAHHVAAAPEDGLESGTVPVMGAYQGWGHRSGLGLLAGSPPIIPASLPSRTLDVSSGLAGQTLVPAEMTGERPGLPSFDAAPAAVPVPEPPTVALLAGLLLLVLALRGARRRGMQWPL